MSEKQDYSSAQGGILTHSLDEYRAKVKEIIRAENERFRQLAQEQAKDIIDGAWQKAEGIIAEGQQNALKIGEDIEQKANQKSSEIIAEAEQKAQQIIREAEEEAKKEAKNRVKSQEEKILAKAREEASSIVANAREKVEKESNEIMERTKKEAEQRFEEEITKFRNEAQAQTSQIRLGAEKKAAELIDDIVEGSKVVNEMIIETVNKSESIFEKMKSDMQVEVGEMTKSVMVARERLEQKITEFSGKSEDETALQSIDGNPNITPALWVTLKGEQSALQDDSNYLFKGQMELKTLSTMDYVVVRKLKGFLVQVPNIKYLGESSSEEGTILLFELKEPSPLMDILSNIPLVEDLVTEGDSIKLILN